MKLWQKICISLLLFFLTVFLSAGVLMIENSWKITFERLLRHAAEEQEDISTGIVRYVWTNIKDLSEGETARYDDTIREYLTGRINPLGNFLEIRAGSEVLYSNLEFREPIIVNSDYEGRLAQYSIQEIDGNRYLILVSHVTVKSLEIDNYYLTDLNDIYADRTLQYSFLGKLTVAVTILIFAGMYLITGHFTKGLRVLRDSVRLMAAGNYKVRVKLNTKDEVRELADNYNDMAAAIEEKIDQLQRKTEEQQRFIDNFTHELRTPLTAVVGYADLLRSTTCGEEYSQELGGHIFQEGKRIEKLSEVMMDLIFLKRHDFQLKPCQVNKAVRQAVRSFEQAAAEAGISLELEIPEKPAWILAKTELAVTLFSNLIDNALKASVQGNRIWIRVRPEEKSVLVEIEDEGRGIPEEEQAKIFESFYMVDKVRNKKNGGIGLGLSICEKIVKIHDANLELTSRQDEGTLIKLCFKKYGGEDAPVNDAVRTKDTDTSMNLL